MAAARSKILWALVTTAAFAATLAGTRVALGGLRGEPVASIPLKPELAAARQKAETDAREAKGMAELEAAAGVPATTEDLKQLDAQLTRSAQEQAALFALQQLGQGQGDPVDLSARGIEDLDRRLAEFKKSVEARQRARSAPQGPVGYLTLSTTNPRSAMVFLDAEPLGATPIAKVPVAAGKHAFRVIGSDGESRRLEANIEAGATRGLGAIDVGKLPKWEP